MKKARKIFKILKIKKAIILRRQVKMSLKTKSN